MRSNETSARPWLIAAIALAPLVGCETPPDEPASQARVVFETRYSEGGRFTVSEDAQGRLTMGVTGVDGADDPDVVLGKVAGRSLVATHQALLPGKEIPAALRGLEDRFVRQLPARAGHPSRPPGAAAPEPSATDRLGQQFISLDPQIWRRNFCRTRAQSSGTAYYVDCYYSSWSSDLCYDVNFARDSSGELTPAAYAKNDSWQKSITFWGPGVVTTLQPRAWGFFNFFSSGEVCLSYEGNGWGPMGLSRHLYESGR